MSTPYRKKLIEVALPLEAINKESAREKSIRHGHPSTLHLWWARRPLAACRAVLFASLVDDPDSDPAYAHYDAETREHMAGEKRQQLFALIEELVKWENSNNEMVINAARAEIARCVASRKIELGELAKDHKLPGGETVYDLVVKGHGDLAKLRDGKVRLPKAESVNGFLAEHAPPVLDPFAGGGSIPLEAQRLGLRAYASDLNPVPVLINKALIEIPPQFANKPPVNPTSRGEAGPAGKKGKGKGKSVLGVSEWRGAQGLAEDVRYYGQWMRDEAEKRIGHFYPKIAITAEMAKDRPDLKPYVGQELTVIAWIWARTVASPNPALAGVHVPLVSSFMLSTKATRKAWAEIDATSLGGTPWRFKVRVGALTREAENKAKLGTRAGKAKDFICALSGVPITRGYVQAEGKAARIGQRLMAIAAEGERGRVYLAADAKAEEAAESCDSMSIVATARSTFLAGTTPSRAMITGGVCSAYGLSSWGHLLTSRQAVALATFSELVGEARDEMLRTKCHRELAPPCADYDDKAYADAIATYLAFALDRMLDRTTTLCTWDSSPKMEALRNTFARQALPMTWDFAEGNPFSESSGNWLKNLNWVTSALSELTVGPPGRANQLDATSSIGEAKGVVISTDPPYYDNISYAELSDFFYVWLRRSLHHFYPTLFSTLLTPKSQELIASAYRHGGSNIAAQEFFESNLRTAFGKMRQAQASSFPLTVYYAFKQAETGEDTEDGAAEAVTASTGWETMLAGLISAGFSVQGTWPLRTELSNRMVGIGANALASSIALSCRPREDTAPLATRREFMTALNRDLPTALRQLQRGGIAPVDLAQAAIGPGMAVFTRYSKVMEADGSPMKVRHALALINQTLDEVLAEQEGEFDADTRWAVAWFEQHGMDEGAFGVADVLARAKNTAVNALEAAGIIPHPRGKVRLLRRDELPDDWNPATDNKVRHWEIAQHLIRALETGGETAAADLLRKVGGMGEIARDLAYRLYNICERKKWASEALAYNGLVIAWPEISKLAQSSPSQTTAVQERMF